MLKPRMHRIRGTPHMDAYEVAGEMIAVRYLCEAGVVALIGAPLPPLTPRKIDLRASLITNGAA